MIHCYDSDHTFARRVGTFDTKLDVVDNDTFTEAARHCGPCCLNFASHKRPGGGYLKLMDLRAPIKTQEEDLFRRSNLPDLMDNDEVRKFYPLRQTRGIYCTTVVTKGPRLDACVPFASGIITVAAVVNPGPSDRGLIDSKIRRIFEIAYDRDQTVLILGAWGCGVFRNDPHQVAQGFRRCLMADFPGMFEKVVFAIPGKDSPNHRIFLSIMADR